MNFYKRHLGDIAKSCSDLSQGQMGAYDLLLDWHYANEKPLPLSLDKLYLIGRARSKPERDNVDSVLSELFIKADTGYTHKRAAEEMAKANAQADTNRRIAEEREATKRARTEHESFNGSYTKRQPSQTPDSRLQEQKQKPAPKGVDFGEVAPEVVVDFTAHRKAQRAPITQTALDAIRREAGKAGLSLEAALVMCCARGWRGFKAEWALGQPARAGPAQAPGKTMQALKTLEDMKNGLADTRNSDRIPEAALLEFGQDSGR